MRDKLKGLVRIKGSLQNKFLILFIFISIIPITLSVMYISGVTLKQMTENVERASVSQLKNMDATIYEKYKNIRRIIENVCINRDIQKILKSDNCDYALFESQIKGCINDNEDIFGVVCITNGGNAYAYNVNANDVDAMRLQIMYSRIDERPGAITWFGNSFLKTQGLGEDMIMAVSTHNRTNEDNSYEQLARIYIYVKNNIFNDVFREAVDDSVLMFDGNGLLLSGIGQEKYRKLFNDDIVLFEALFSGNEGILKTDISSKQNTSFAYYSSKFTGFKYLKAYNNDVLYEKIDSVKWYAIILIALLTLVALAVYVTIVKTITKPMVILADRMKNMSWDKLDKKIDVNGNDEVSNIIRGYNRMLDEISDMLLEVKEKEEQKKKSDIRALNYQINPHFLHNTLASVRIVAMKHNDMEVAQAIFDINRILKSVFSSASGKIAVGEEIKLLNSFTRLFAIRYNGRIVFTVEADEEIENEVIPSLIIQPLLENAVLHGVAPKMKDPGFVPKINISITGERDEVKISVRDNGVGMEEEYARDASKRRSESSSGIGIANVDERIKLIYGNEYGVSVESQIGEYTCLTIVLPTKLSDKSDNFVYSE